MTDRIEALARAYALKDETRTGWVLRGVTEPESVAAHTWGLSTLVLQFCPDGLDRERALALAAVHDVAEAVTGDVATRAEAGAQTVDPGEKARRERAAMDGPLAELGGEVRELWAEYEDRETPEARFVKDADLLDQCLQALVYEREGRYDEDAENPDFDSYEALDEFFATAEPRLSTDVARRLFEEIRSRYESVK